ncbi:hypothetical protein TV39_20210 [Arthrobacter sp. SPG23]|nr:hypothetical protein TV39_20210 [Arthrobacter sp. SPG23]
MVERSAVGSGGRLLKQAPQHLRRRIVRADIQALRALAVGLVVLNHMWPDEVTGGYVGVDVFFVISGFLITSHLLKELNASGSIRLKSFYARRVRRLLPAAFLVLAVSLICSLVWLPFSRWVTTAQEVLASTLYAENWLLAAKSIDYSASTATATVAQHYWSLSVEEQFYLVWPLLLVALFALAARLHVSSRRMIWIGVSAVTVLGFLASAVVTVLSPEQAYFVTPVRAWEFGAGALVSLTMGQRRARPLSATVLSLGGFAMIWGAALFFGKETAFPGWLAVVPVLGTVLVLVAGSDDRFAPLRTTLSWPPIQYLGNISYSLYLWHWPFIVMAPYALSRPLENSDRILIVVAAVILAGLTKSFVEDRGQTSSYLSHSPRRTFSAMAVATALIAVLAVTQIQATDFKNAEAKQASAAAALQPCHGPMALLPGADCPDRFGPSVTPVTGGDNAPTPVECVIPDGDESRRDCDFSAGVAGADVVWLVGDSHAQHWQSAVFKVARERQWIVKTAYLGGCPLVTAHFQGFDGAGRDQGHARKCMSWAKSITDTVVAERPAAVFTSSFAREQAVDDGSGKPPFDQFTAALRVTWKNWTDAGANVYVLADPPLNKAVRSPDCTLLHAGVPADCAVERNLAQPADPLVAGVEGAANGNVVLLDFTDYFCSPEKCYTVVGGVDVYYDANHLNHEYAELLAPMVLDRIS